MAVGTPGENVGADDNASGTAATRRTAVTTFFFRSFWLFPFPSSARTVAACRYRSKSRGISDGPGLMCPRFNKNASWSACKSTCNRSAISLMTASDAVSTGQPRIRCNPLSSGTVDVIDSGSKIETASFAPPLSANRCRRRRT